MKPLFPINHRGLLLVAFLSLFAHGVVHGFVHPGILVNGAQLDFVKGKIAINQEPWTAAFDNVKASKYGKATYTPTPVAVVGCGEGGSGIDEGCTEEMSDAIAAYTQALLWYFTGQNAYALKSIQIMNAWSKVFKDHKFDMTKYTNGHLQAAWVAEEFTRAAEIIRYTKAGWLDADVERFSTMLDSAFLPHVIHGWTGGGGNWQLSMAEATINIGVFTDNQTTFAAGLALWRAQVPSMIYLESDGNKPIFPPPGTVVTDIDKYWYQQKVYVDGLDHETCRDFSHTAMGFAGAINGAETARIQGVDLYKEEARRITTSLEFHARYLNGAKMPDWLCNGVLDLGGEGYKLTWEIGYNHYSGRMGMALPETKALISKIRPAAAALHMAWEALTHANTGNVIFLPVVDINFQPKTILARNLGGRVSVQINCPEKCRFEIVDLRGHNIFGGVAHKAENVLIPSELLSEGVYYLRFTASGRNEIARILMVR